MKSVQQISVGIVVTLIALFAQSTLVRFMQPHVVPNFCVLFVVFLSFHEATLVGAFMTFLVGLIFDVSSGVLLGPWSAGFTATFCVLTLLSKRVYLESLPAAVLVGFLSALLSTSIYTGLLYQFQPQSLEASSLLIESGMTAIVAPVVLRMFYALLVQKLSIYGLRGAGGI